jgi:LPXTG-motif cell wall-anchored protein
MNKYLKWSLIIGGVALVGFGVYYFGFRKKAK